MISVQGPQAIELLDTMASAEMTSLRYYTGQMMTVTPAQMLAVLVFVRLVNVVTSAAIGIPCHFMLSRARTTLSSLSLDGRVGNG